MKVSPLPGQPAPTAMLVTVVKLVRLCIWSATARPVARINSSRGYWSAARLQSRANCGMM